MASSKIRHAHRRVSVPDGPDRRLVRDVGEVGADESRRTLCDHVQVYVGAELHGTSMQAQNRLAIHQVRLVHHDLPIEPPGAQQRLVQNLRAVGGSEHHHTGGRIESVHLREQLVQGLLALVVPSQSGTDAAGAADRIQLVDENDARCFLASLLEQLAHPGGSHADEQLDELRSADVEKRHARLPGNRPRQQCLARAGRANQESTLGHAATQALNARGVLEKIDHFLQFFFRLLGSGHIIEGHPHSRLGVDVDPVGAQVEQPAIAHPPRKPSPCQRQRAERQYPVE